MKQGEERAAGAGHLLDLIFLLVTFLFQEENEVTEFFVTLEKDPQQEDFLQGRMPGNPYSSNEPGIGPLMRDIKNKICQDCDLVALLEDDSGMERLEVFFLLLLSLATFQLNPRFEKRLACCHFDYAATVTPNHFPTVSRTATWASWALLNELCCALGAYTSAFQQFSECLP
ncbi:hypothetical protein FKM82_010235 [Ascaphus truei]